MTDKPVPPNGGDGGSETPTERLLREAMNARTSLITAHDLRPDTPPGTRIRRLRPVYMVTVPLLGLAAAAAIGVVTLKGSPVADHEVQPPAATMPVSPSPTPAATATPTTSATQTPVSDGEPGSPLADATSVGGPAKPYAFRGVKFTVPAGWRAVPGPTASSLCVLAQGAPQSADGSDCQPYGALLTVYTSPDEVDKADAWPSAGASTNANGWSKQPYCPVWGDPHAPGASDAVKNAAPTSTRDIVAGRSAYKSLWQVSCNDKESFTAQMWRFPQEQVYLTTAGLKPELQSSVVSILDTMDLTGYKTPATSSNVSDIGITFDGLGTGQQVPVKSAPVTFSVTYRNTSRTNYASVQPLLFTETYAGTPDSAVLPMNKGKLERQDGDTWVQVPLSQGGGTDYATAGKAASFPLAPGQSKAVKYRFTLDEGNGAGVMPVTAQAVLPYDGTGQLTVIGATSVPVRVTK